MCIACNASFHPTDTRTSEVSKLPANAGNRTVSVKLLLSKYFLSTTKKKAYYSHAYIPHRKIPTLLVEVHKIEAYGTDLNATTNR